MVMSIIAACISGVVFSMGSIEAFLQNTSYNRDNSSQDVVSRIFDKINKI